MPKNHHSLLQRIGLILVAISAACGLLAGCAPASQDGSHRIVNVYYAGLENESGGVSTAIDIGISSGLLARVTDPAQADVFVINGAVSDPARIAPYLQNGDGLVLIPGASLTADKISTLLGTEVQLQALEEPVSLNIPEGITDPLTEREAWNSAPQIRQRALLDGVTLSAIVTSYEDQSTLLGSFQVGKGQAYYFAAYLSGDANPQIQEWMYFNYFIYHLAVRAAGETPLTFGNYPGSPVPHAAERNLLLALMALILITAFVLFAIVRRYSKKHPEALDAIVANHKVFEVKEEKTRWEEIGFHRPLSGFLVALVSGLFLFIPLIIYQNLILPVYILPSAQALGIWGRVTQFFNFAWLFFDMGTSVAFIKYLSEYRVHDPRKGIQFGQLFVWWQALSGAVQVSLVIALSSTAMVHTAYAFYAWSVIVHTFIQIPGFFGVMRSTFSGFQRQDYARILDIGLNMIFPMLIQPIFVTIMFAWGKSNPMFGGAMGGLLGMGIAAYASELLTFVVGLRLYKRIGYNSRILFMAHFDWDVIKRSFKFGVFEMLGSISWAAGQAAEIWVTQARLVNYSEIWGNWVLAQNFIFAFNVLQTLYEGTMPAISEAISNGKRALSQYYSALAYKWGGLGSAFLCSVLLATADRFILGASGVEFARAAQYVIPLVIWGAIQYFSWVGDIVQLGSNRPWLKAMMVFGEQSIRIMLLLLLLSSLQVNALILAYFVGLLIKGISVYFINHRICYPQRFYFWQSLAAPILAGVVHYIWLRLLTGLIWQNDQITSMLIFLIGILPSFPIYMFLHGFFGGWDDATLQEFKDAVALTGVLRPISRLIWRSAALGARISPLHNRFPITIRQSAIDEARILTEEKVKL